MRTTLLLVSILVWQFATAFIAQRPIDLKDSSVDQRLLDDDKSIKRARMGDEGHHAERKEEKAVEEQNHADNEADENTVTEMIREADEKDKRAGECENRCLARTYKHAPPPACGDGIDYPDECRAHCAGAKQVKEGSCSTIASCICPTIYQPVCSDGKTYGNVCSAHCAGAKDIVDGECPVIAPACKCSDNHNPVCANGRTYKNECMAHCAGATKVTKGECCEPCKKLCVDVYAPVCADGVTYNNECLTSCLCPKPNRVVPGECQQIPKEKPACRCKKINKPVCGEGKTYSNGCEARCAGVQIVTEGPCCVPCFVKCANIINPVCVDGVTYQNACLVACQCPRPKRIVPGKCRRHQKPKPCICPKIYEPVCGDDQTYPNKCQARCAGVKKVTEGLCCPPCAVKCSSEYKPVCADGVTYKNSCLTACLCPKPKRIMPGECSKNFGS